MRLPKTDPKILIWVGALSLVVGFVLPLLMVIKALPSTYFLNFLSYAFQLIGMITAMLGTFSIVKVRLDKEKAKDNIFLDPTDHPDE